MDCNLTVQYGMEYRRYNFVEKNGLWYILDITRDYTEDELKAIDAHLTKKKAIQHVNGWAAKHKEKLKEFKLVI